MPSSVKLAVYYDDGREVEVAVSPKAQVMAERHFKVPLPEQDSAEHLYYLAWCALTIKGLEHGDFDTFLGNLAEVEPAGEQAVNPTQPGPSPDSSSS